MVPILLLCTSVLLAADPAPLRPVAELEKVARSTTGRDQSKAIRDLGLHGNAAAAKVLVSLVDDPAAGRNALSALRDLKDPAAAAHLHPLLKHGESRVRAAAAAALGSTGNRDSAPLLAALVTSEPEGYVKTQAIPALARVAHTEEHLRVLTGLMQDRRWADAAQRALKQLREPALAPALVPLLKEPEPRTRALICEVLGQLGNPDTAVALMDSVERDQANEVRHAAADALGTVADASALPRVVKILRTHGVAHSTLVKSLVQVDRTNGHAVCRQLVKDGDPLGRDIVLAITSDARPSDDAVVLMALQSRNNDARREAVNALAYVHTPRVREALCRQLKEETDPVIQGMTAESLENHPGDETVKCLVEGFAHVKRPGPGSSGEYIQRTLRHLTGQNFEYDEKAWKAWVLGGLGSRADPAGLAAALSDRDNNVRELAARQLGKAADKGAATDALLAALGGERSAAVRVVMLQSLVALRQPRAVEPLVKLLESPLRPEERVAVVRALDDLGDARGTLYLVERLERGDQAERDEAAAALSQVTGEPAHRNAARWREWWKKQAERYRRP